MIALVLKIIDSIGALLLIGGLVCVFEGLTREDSGQLGQIGMIAVGVAVVVFGLSSGIMKLLDIRANYVEAREERAQLR